MELGNAAGDGLGEGATHPLAAAIACQPRVLAGVAGGMVATGGATGTEVPAVGAPKLDCGSGKEEERDGVVRSAAATMGALMASLSFCAALATIIGLAVTSSQGAQHHAQ